MSFGSKPDPTAQHRLRTGDAFALNNERIAATANSDRDRARQAVIVYGREHLNRLFTPHEAGLLLERMVDHLKTSPMITNFNMTNMWKELGKNKAQYKNVFELSGRGALADKQRANVEELMFDYLNASGGVNSNDASVRSVAADIKRWAPRYTDPDNIGRMVTKDMVSGIKAPEDFDDFNLAFVPTMRVRYCAVDFARLKCGHEKWGDTCMYYREYMRHNMTFICQDSFAKFYTDQIDENNGVHAFRDRVRQFKVAPEDCKDHIGTMHNLYPLFKQMPFGLMQALHDAVERRLNPGRSWSSIQDQYKLERDDYFEGHFHGEIRLDRDIEMMRIRKKPGTVLKYFLPLKVYSKKTHTRIEWV